MESQAHIDLVKIAYQYISEKIEEENRPLIETDSSGNNSSFRVQGNFIPDVYYSLNGRMFIGEAKTELDFERKHSKDQYDSYLEELNDFDGEGWLVISVPWQMVPTAKNYFKRKKNNEDIQCTIIILNELGKEHIV